MDYYYQIKGKSSYSKTWEWPPSVSGKVSAKNKKEARKKIEDEFGRDFCLRVLKADFDKTDYLLRIVEISDENAYLADLFSMKECAECKRKFRVIDKYNNEHETNKGGEFCSSSCCESSRRTFAKLSKLSAMYESVGQIYAITNKTNGKVYVGKTTQVFTLRWYQHFFQGSGTPFHNAISESDVTDWVFSVVETVKIEREQNLVDVLSEREAYWISHYDSLDNGYNTMKVNVVSGEGISEVVEK